MPVDDTWYLKRLDPATGKKAPSKRHGQGKRWRVRWLDESDATVTRFFNRRPDAERFDAEVRTDVSRGLFIDQAAGKVTVAEHAEAWRLAQLHRDSTAGLIERAFRLHINPVIGSLPIGRIRSTHIQSLVKNLDLAPSSARVVYSYRWRCSARRCETGQSLARRASAFDCRRYRPPSM
jgi:hypothetical protein